MFYKRRLAALVAGLFWGLLLYFGVELCRGAASQGTAGLPSGAQLMLYVFIPSLMMLISAALILAAGSISIRLFSILIFLIIIFILPVFMLFGGGV